MITSVPLRSSVPQFNLLVMFTIKLKSSTVFVFLTGGPRAASHRINYRPWYLPICLK